MSENAQHARICAAVDAAFSEQTEFLAELVRTPTQRTEEAAGQQLMAQAFADLGLRVERISLDPQALAAHEGAGAVTVDYSGMEVVIGTTEHAPDTSGTGETDASGTGETDASGTGETDASGAGRSLILNGHIDVVPVGNPALWSREPYDPVIVDGRLHGRGAGDMKAGLSANVFALRALQSAGLRPRGRVELQSVPEEECTGNGTLAAFLAGRRADAVLIPEPAAEFLVSACLGVIWFEMTVRTRAAHAAEMSAGLNAIDAAGELIAALRRLEVRWNEAAADDRHFGGIEHPLNLNVGTFRAGEWPSSVPDTCTVGMRIAILPGVRAEQAFAELQECAAAAAAQLEGVHVELTPIGFFAEGYVLEPGSAAEQALAGAHAAVHGPGAQLDRVPMTGYIDSRVYGLYADMPALVYGPVTGSIHSADEYVELDSLRRLTQTIALFIADFCGVEEV